MALAVAIEELTRRSRKNWRLHGCFFLFLLFAVNAVPQSQTPAPAPPQPGAPSQDPLNRTSPQSAVSAFLELCHAKNYERAMRYLDLRKLRADERLRMGPQLAQQLAVVLETDAQFDVAALSKEPEGDRKDNIPAGRERIAAIMVKGKPVEIDLERTQLRAGLFVWHFASDTVAQIPAMAQAASETPAEKSLPEPLVRWRLLDTSLWRWIALVVAAAALAGISRLFSRVVLKLVKPLSKRLLPRIDWTVFDRVVGPLQILIAVALFRIAVEAVDPAPRLRLYVGRVLTLATFLGIAWLCAVVVDLTVGRIRWALDSRHRTFASSVLPLTNRIVNITIFVIAIIAVLSSWGYNTSAVLTGLGIGGIAIALAAQKTVENLFGGVAVITDRPVYVGETCKFGDSAGVVEDIGLRSTRIRTADRTLLTVPNAQLSSVTVENLSRRDKMLFHPVFNLARDTTPDQVRSILQSVGQLLKSTDKVEAGDLPVRFIGVSPNSLDVEVFAYIVTLDGGEFLRIQQELLLKILDAVIASGTVLAAPPPAAPATGLQPR
jgi:MscS family membrane protein